MEKVIAVRAETLEKIARWIEEREPVNAALALRELVGGAPQVEVPADRLAADDKAAWYVS